MPCPLVGRTKLSHRIQYFFIWSFVVAHVTCSNSEWGYRDFLWTKGTPNYISRNRAALVNISREQRNKPNFGGSECGNLENSSVSMHWPYAFVIVRRQSVFRCFINIQKDADERKLTQAGRTNIAIYAPKGIFHSAHAWIFLKLCIIITRHMQPMKMCLLNYIIKSWTQDATLTHSPHELIPVSK